MTDIMISKRFKGVGRKEERKYLVDNYIIQEGYLQYQSLPRRPFTAPSVGRCSKVSREEAIVEIICERV